MREAYEKNPNMTEAEAKELLDRCLKVLFYRDARSWNSVSLIKAHVPVFYYHTVYFILN